MKFIITFVFLLLISFLIVLIMERSRKPFSGLFLLFWGLSFLGVCLGNLVLRYIQDYLTEWFGVNAAGALIGGVAFVLIFRTMVGRGY